MTRAALLTRLSRAAKKPSKYGLGAGRIVPRGDSPLDENGKADCSAFVMWALGLPKFDKTQGWLKNFNGGWYNTDGIWLDRYRGTGFFVEVNTVDHDIKVGDVIVYPARWVATKFAYTGRMSTIGHVGIVSRTLPGELDVLSNRMIHCSAGNVRRHKRAIVETGFKGMMEKPHVVFLRPSVLT